MISLYAANNQLFRTEDDGIRRLDLDAVVDRPAILIDAESDTLIKWGSFSKIEEIARKYESFTGIEGLPQVTLFQLNQLTAEEQAYIINRMLRYTASGFVQEFAKMSTNLTAGRDWLHSEMERLPV